jgi:hypothetical protein
MGILTFTNGFIWHSTERLGLIATSTNDPEKPGRSPMSMRSGWLALSLCSFAFACPLVAQETLPIYACVSIPGGAFSTPERYRELAEAGFTTSLTGFGNLTQALAALTAATGTGVSVFVACPELTSDTANAVETLRTHPALAGYHLSDEPSAAAFGDLAAWTKKIQAIDTSHPCYINLLPTYANTTQLGTPTYQEYIDRFVDTVPVPLISFDHYPTSTGPVQSGHFENLEIVAAAARRVRKPFWGFYQATLFAATQPSRTLAQLRFESFTNLAYGAQCIQAYTYWTTFPEDREAPIDRDGKRTPTYALIKQVNHEIRAWSRVFKDAQVESVTHAGQAIPKGTRPFAAHGGLRALKVGAGSAVVSFLQTHGNHYLVIVNANIHATLTLTTTFDDPRSINEVRTDGQDRPLTGTDFTVALGDLLVFQTQVTRR